MTGVQDTFKEGLKEGLNSPFDPLTLTGTQKPLEGLIPDQRGSRIQTGPDAPRRKRYPTWRESSSPSQPASATSKSWSEAPRLAATKPVISFSSAGHIQRPISSHVIDPKQKKSEARVLIYEEAKLDETFV